MKILMPLPLRDFDPSEAAVSWSILRNAGHEIIFATPTGQVAAADPIMLSGIGLDFWSRIPGLRQLKLIGLLLRAKLWARRAYARLQDDANFRAPKRYADLRADDFDGLILPGGHAQGMKPYLESKPLQDLIVGFFEADKPVGAICHGVLLAARSISPRTGLSVLHGRRTTALTWQQERTAWRLNRYAGRYWDPDYYRTYREGAGEPEGFWSVEAEVKRLLAKPEDFLDVPRDDPHRFARTSGIAFDSLENPKPAWVVRDGNYVSARWPGDVHTFAKTFLQLLATPDK